MRHQHSSFAMLCQAQAFPVPLIRYVCVCLCGVVTHFRSSYSMNRNYNRFAFGFGCTIYIKIMLALHRISIQLVQHATMNNEKKLISFISQIKSKNVEILEPVSSKSPTFQTDSKVSMFVRKTGEDFALLCLAQAYPVPLIRYV